MYRLDEMERPMHNCFFFFEISCVNSLKILRFFSNNNASNIIFFFFNMRKIFFRLRFMVIWGVDEFKTHTMYKV